MCINNLRQNIFSINGLCISNKLSFMLKCNLLLKALMEEDSCFLVEFALTFLLICICERNLSETLTSLDKSFPVGNIKAEYISILWAAFYSTKNRVDFLSVYL